MLQAIRVLDRPSFLPSFLVSLLHWCSSLDLLVPFELHLPLLCVFCCTFRFFNQPFEASHQ
ncbi:unnamed protein product, partial [Citrullus colocynthis]